jgi:2-methylisocitrate lyase-like PEP mutase family enzyme
MLAEAGAAGFSIEDYDRDSGGIDEVGRAADRVAEAAEASRAQDEPLVLTGRAENHIRGVDDLEDTIARLTAYRDAGADVVYAPGLTDLGQIARVVDAVGAPLNVLALRAGPTLGELASAGVRRISTGSLLASVAYGALLAGARELKEDGTSCYAEGGASSDALKAAFDNASTKEGSAA